MATIPTNPAARDNSRIIAGVDQTSDSLYEALRRAQATLPDVSKTKTAKVRGKSKSGESFEYSYKYADISDILAVIRPHLAKHGLAILQPTRIDNGALVVVTRIVHASSGQVEEGVYPVAAIGADHQALGSALTYARRYALCAMIGLAPDDDADGRHAADSGKVVNPKTGRMVDPNSSNQLRTHGVWTSFLHKLGAFVEASDLDGLEHWFAQPETKAKIEKWPENWQVLAQEEYEQAQESMWRALAAQPDEDGG